MTGLTDGECEIAALRELIAQRRAQLHLNQIAAILLVDAAGHENSL